MKPSVELPKELERSYYEIEAKFDSISSDWEKYNDQIIPEDKEFAKEILRFIIGVLNYILSDYEKIEVDKWQEFLSSYWYTFYYGPNGDDANYLDFDEVSVASMLMSDFQGRLSREQFAAENKKFEEELAKF